MKQLLVIGGPTASGKTAMAIRIAQELNTHILSCDSRQFYAELNIGVARPTPQELQSAPHHFIATHSIHQPLNVSSYEQSALALLQQLFLQHDTLIAVGGSGLYIDALCQGVAYLPDPTPELRAQLKASYAIQGISYFQQMLQQLDPDYYNQVDRNNPIRLQRAIEVSLTAHKPYSQVLREQVHAQQRPFRIVKIGIDADRQWLRQRINQRVDAMMDQGLLEECQQLLPYRGLTPLNTVGYKELFAHIDGQSTLDEAVAAIKLNTWHYAKKQFTWLRRYTDLTWVAPNATAHYILDRTGIL